jgi:hypothetical protein
MMFLRSSKEEVSKEINRLAVVRLLHAPIKSGTLTTGFRGAQAVGETIVDALEIDLGANSTEVK